MRSTEVVNATLVRVDSATGEDDWSAIAGQGEAKLEEPAVGVMYDESRQRILTGSGPRVHVWRTLTVREELGVDWQIGDVVTIRPYDLGQQDLVGVVSAVEDPHTGRGDAGDVVLTLDLQG